jgi:hypothetical protein
MLYVAFTRLVSSLHIRHSPQSNFILPLLSTETFPISPLRKRRPLPPPTAAVPLRLKLGSALTLYNRLI